ncbi:hypothetical protein [Streptococcus pyogenes]|uniref:hypothetical protein n=1 Tax=Streptococcus pyogenes TaxID=1314 RepID=UPI00109D7AE7|nr:hypothetical protein [Streptococcus pyogenes]VHE73916.1 Pentapeptide repeats (8 copies) [Streptococcus pyogenes]
MKTKSKRFLNLATLCLALLGTTLLTTQPAEAEVILYRPDWTSRGSDSQAKSQAKDDPYQRGREEGHKAGLEAAKKGGKSTISPGDVPKPYGSDEQKNGLYKSGYTDMYRHGYSAGQHSLEGRGNEGRGNEGRGNEGRGNEGRGNEGSGNEGRGNEGRGNEGSGNEGSGNEGSGNEGSGNEGRGNEEATTDDSSVEESGGSSIIDEVVDIVYQAVSTIWSYLRGWF